MVLYVKHDFMFEYLVHYARCITWDSGWHEKLDDYGTPTAKDANADLNSLWCT